MHNLQLFSFNSNEVRVMTDHNNNVWFNAKDVCDCLAIQQSRKAVKTLDEDEKHGISITTSTGLKKQWFVNESGIYSLIFQSRKAEAKQFKKWVTSEVLPTIRKTGSYNFKALILPSPSDWHKTFPDEFMRQVMRLYGYSFDRTKGTPQFVGHFVNKYIYNTLDHRMSNELKEARKIYGGNDEVAFLHQFLNTDGKEFLIKHIENVTYVAAGAATIDQFDVAFNRIYVHKNQLEMYLR